MIPDAGDLHICKNDIYRKRGPRFVLFICTNHISRDKAETAIPGCRMMCIFLQEWYLWKRCPRVVFFICANHISSIKREAAFLSRLRCITTMNRVSSFHKEWKIETMGVSLLFTAVLPCCTAARIMYRKEAPRLYFSSVTIIFPNNGKFIIIPWRWWQLLE